MWGVVKGDVAWGARLLDGCGLTARWAAMRGVDGLRINSALQAGAQKLSMMTTSEKWEAEDTEPSDSAEAALERDS